MKVLVAQLSEDTWNSHGAPLQQPVPLELDPSLGLQKTFIAVCDVLKITPTDRDAYVLQLDSTKQYIDRDAIFGALFGSSTGKVYTLILRRKPTLRAQELVKALFSNEEGGKEKDVVFQMRYALADTDFAESFIDRGGVGALLDLVSRAKGNTQTYALHALRQCMEYVSGMAIVMGTPHLVKELFTLIDSPVVGVCRTALELLFVMCGYAKENGFTSVHRAAKATATGAGKEPYANVIALLAAGQDLETMVNAFTLLNVLLMTCPESKAEKLFRRWERLNLNDKLRTLTEIQHQQFQVQLEIYEETTGVNLRTRASRLEAQCRQLKAKLREYEQQQALVVLLREELRRIQHFVSEAWNDGTLISSAPMKRYLGPAHPEYPADLSFLKTAAIEREKATELSATNTKLNQQLQALQAQHTQATEQLESYRVQLETLRGASALLAAAQEQLVIARAAHTDALGEANAERETLNTLLQAERSRVTSLKASYEQMLREMSMERDRLLDAVDSLQRSLEYIQSNTGPAKGETTDTASALEGASAGSISDPLGVFSQIVGSAATEVVFETSAGASISSVEAALSKIATASPSEKSESSPSVSSTDGSAASSVPLPALPETGPPTEIPLAVPSPASLPPPPPPPMSGVRSLKPNKPEVIPNAKMRPLYWKRLILPQITRPPSIWDEITEPQFNQVELDEKFSVKATAPQAHQPASASEKLLSVLDMKKSNAISFMIAKLPPFAMLKDAVNRMDNSKLNREQLKQLLSSLPTQEEVQGIQALAESLGGGVKLDKPERFVLEIFSIPRVRELLDCWLFQLECTEAVRNLQSSIDSIAEACKATRSSPALRKTLGTVLAVGNYMNGGTARGQADGFTIDALDTLATTKDTTNSGTLLDYIAYVLSTRYSVDLAIELVKELAPLSTAKSAQMIETLQEDLNALKKKAERVRTLMESAVSDLEQSHEFVLTFPKALAHLENTIAVLGTSLKKAETDFGSLLEFFGYTKSIAKEVKTPTFFGWISSFAQAMAKYSEKEKQAVVAAKRDEMRPKSAKFGKKIAQGQDPLAALANAIKLGAQMPLRNNVVRKTFAAQEK
jgi:hypothetical protein